MPLDPLTPDLRLTLIKDQKVRRALTRESHFYFFHVYFGHYVTCPTAPFQKEIFGFTEDATQGMVAITAFRGSAKSTIVSLSFPLWAILGKLGIKFVLILGQTQSQARQHLKNLKDEIERNPLLRKDLGPFDEREDEWNSSSIVLPLLGARITAASTETSVRGIRHGPHRPQLIICDDIEDLQSVKTREGRDKTYQWLMGEVIPAGGPKTRTFIIGNLLHEDCLLKKFERHILNGSMSGIYREYPLLDAEGKTFWPGKYPTQQAIDDERMRIGNEAAWHREFLLTILSDAERVIHPEWVRRYDEFPTERSTSQGGTSVRFMHTATGIDLAISLSDSADYTAMVSARIYYIEGKIRIYILPNPINARLTALDTLERAKQVAEMTGNGKESKLYIEDVGYQSSLVEHLKEKNCDAEAVKVKGQDKRARLALTSHAVQSGQVLFPRKGAEDLINQLTNFGIEKHDDLADAFSLLIIKALEEKIRSFGICFIGDDGSLTGWDSIRGEINEPGDDDVPHWDILQRM
jgi:predicted phage terminase large subunit-like protein